MTMTPNTDSVAVLRELMDEYPAPNFTAERAALTAAINALEAQGEAVYQCMCTDEDDIPNGPRDIWMDVDRESFDKLRQRDDVRSRVLYLHPAPPGSDAVTEEKETPIGYIKCYELSGDIAGDGDFQTEPHDLTEVNRGESALNRYISTPVYRRPANDAADAIRAALAARTGKPGQQGEG